MNDTAPPPPTTHRAPRAVLLCLLALLVTLLLAASRELLPSAISAAGSPVGAVRDLFGQAPDESDGVVPDGVTVLDDRTPAVAKLDPALRGALRRAAEDAAGDGIVLPVNSGWRSAAYQEALLRRVVLTHGSRAEAARWVATAQTSPHVSGDAVDIGGAEATAWLSAHGAGFGLCQVYRNEPWHFELRPRAVEEGCPTGYVDPTRDPRMRQ